MPALSPWKSTNLMLAATRAKNVKQLGLPPTIYAPTRTEWGPPDHHAGLDWAILREAKGPTTQAITQE